MFAVGMGSTMRLPKAKSVDRQGRLFHVDRPLSSKGETRWAAGEFFEQAVAVASGGERLRTDATADICPDVRIAAGQFAESKCVGRTGAVIFYEGRFLKDRAFMAATGHEIVYWFWRHDYAVLKAESYDELRQGLAGAAKVLVIVDPVTLAQSVEGKPVRVVNSAHTAEGGRLGYGNAAKGYGVGWTIRMTYFTERSISVTDRLKVRVYGHTLDVPVLVSRPEYARLITPQMVQGELF